MGVKGSQKALLRLEIPEPAKEGSVPCVRSPSRASELRGGRAGMAQWNLEQSVCRSLPPAAAQNPHEPREGSEPPNRAQMLHVASQQVMCCCELNKESGLWVRAERCPRTSRAGGQAALRLRCVTQQSPSRRIARCVSCRRRRCSPFQRPASVWTSRVLLRGQSPHS